MKVAKTICCVLCEDIREEKGDKLSYLGVYGITNAGVVLDRLPSMLPKLCLAVMLSEVQCELNKCNITVISSGLKKISLDLPQIPKYEIGKNLTLGVTIAPFKFQQEGKSKIELRFNDDKKASLIFEFNVNLKTQTITVPTSG